MRLFRVFWYAMLLTLTMLPVTAHAKGSAFFGTLSSPKILEKSISFQLEGSGVIDNRHAIKVGCVRDDYSVPSAFEVVLEADGEIDASKNSPQGDINSRLNLAKGGNYQITLILLNAKFTCSENDHMQKIEATGWMLGVQAPAEASAVPH